MRLRLTKLDEFQLLTCVKHGIWGSEQARFRDWQVGDLIAFKVGETIAGLAEITGEAFVSGQRVFGDGVYPHRIPIRFSHFAFPEHRLPILDDVREALVPKWGKAWGLAVQGQRLLSGEASETIATAIRSQPNDLQRVEASIEQYLAEAQLERDLEALPPPEKEKKPESRKGPAPGEAGPERGAAELTETTQRPFSIRIFFPYGTPDGLRIVDKPNWTGCGIVCPRSLFPQAKSRKEFSCTGVYVLVGPSDRGEQQIIYLGEGDPIRPRLEQHYAQKDFWTWAVAFVSSKDGSLNKAHVQHLEARLVQLARDAQRADLNNQNVPKQPALSESEKADVESFLAEMLSILPVLGLAAFEKPPAARTQLLAISTKGMTAKGYESPQGFVVTAGSEAAVKMVSSASPRLISLHKELLANGVLTTQDNHLRFTRDHEFNSPSQAAGIVMGRNANGRKEWKNPEKHTLAQIQAAQATA